ncbi:hypothetical protein LSM04_005815 [Trypanosoma melophagium]|uniref:uncharacterized protein n=1 Tax=Trypanosoma melophagium TaxID=715481 RepID=UPI00351AAC2E|nr:hypothetical protein LSM04_005815 [Trypanosoma melophagium]
MGRRRAQFITARLARQYPEQHKSIMRDVERLEREARGGTSCESRLPASARALLRVLRVHSELRPYIAQGSPACVPAVLGRIGTRVERNRSSSSSNNNNNNDVDYNSQDEDDDLVLLNFVSVLESAGTFSDAMMEGLSKNLSACVSLIFTHNVAIAHLAGTLIGTTVRLASDGEKLAVRLLSGEDFWRQFDNLFFIDELETEMRVHTLGVLSVCLMLLRSCCGVHHAGCGPVISRLQKLCSYASVRNDEKVRNELLLLLVVLRSNVEEANPCVDKCLNVLTAPIVDSTNTNTNSCDTDTDSNNSDHGIEREIDSDKEKKEMRRVLRTFSEALAGVGGDEIPTVAITKAIESLQKDQFDTSARLRDLHTIARLFFRTSAPVGVAAALLLLLPGALKGVFAAASGVDENVSAYACSILAAAIDGDGVTAWVTTEERSYQGKQRHQKSRRDEQHEKNACNYQQYQYEGFDPSYYQKCLVEDFFRLGGVVLLEDLLTDYSNGVVMAAVRLLQSLLRFSSDAYNVILASRCIDNLCGALESISQDEGVSAVIQRSDGKALLLLALNTFTLLDAEAIRLVPENALSCMGTIATEAKENTGILAAAIRVLSLLAAVYPMAATLVLDYEYIHTVLTLGINDNLSELDAIFIIGSFDIMSSIVSRESSCVTFEWIETLMLASRRVQDWEESVPGYARAFWGVVLETVKASDDGIAYLFEDEEFVELLLSALTRCCSQLLPVNILKKTKVNNISDGFSEDDQRRRAFELLPVLVNLMRHMPLLQHRQNLSECYILEAVSLLITARDGNVSPDLIVDVVLSVIDNDLLWNVALDILSSASPHVVTSLLERVESFHTDVETVSSKLVPQENVEPTVEGGGEVLASVDTDNDAPQQREEEKEVPANNFELKDFYVMLALLSALLDCSAAARTPATLEAITKLVKMALQSPRDSLMQSSLYACILRSLGGVMHIGNDNLREATQQFCSEEQIVEILSQHLESLEKDNSERKSDVLYNVLEKLQELNNISSSSLALRENVFFEFTMDHLFRDCGDPICRSIFIALCENSVFLHRMLETQEEAYRASLSTVSLYDNTWNAEDSV